MSRSRLGGLALVMVVVTAFVVSIAAVRWEQRARLETEQDLPAEVQAEVEATWDRFVDVFGPRRRCFDDVSLRLVGELPAGDARYLPAEGRIEIRIPTSPRRFRESLVHELAHHVEHSCSRFADLRVEFAPLIGEDRAWFGEPGDRWQDRPTEIWAETAVQVVNGERVRFARTMPLPDGAEAAVLAWAAGG